MTLADIITSYVIELLRETQITSASPGFTNVVKDVRVTGLGSEFDQELDIAIAEKIEEFKVTNPEFFEEIPISKEPKTAKIQGTEKIATGLARQGASLVQNPANAFASLIPLLPHAALLALAISLAPFIFDFLTKPGGPMDLRFRRIIREEINGFLSRQAQKDTEFGVRQVVIQSKTGFTAANGQNNYNTLRGIREGGVNEELLARVGKVDHTKGDWWPFG